MKLENKKGQGSEFFGVVFLIIILVIALLFNKIINAKRGVSKTEETLQNYQNIYITTSVTKFPYITEKGIPINELMGNYVCYSKKIYDYGPNLGKIDMIKTIKETLNQTFGSGNWKMELNKSVCITSENEIGYFEPEGPSDAKTCTTFSGEEFVIYEFLYPLPCRVDFGSGKIYIKT